MQHRYSPIGSAHRTTSPSSSSLTVAWTHACIGLYFWLRMKSFFDWAAPYLLAVAILLPTLAMVGAHHAGREVAPLSEDAEWRKENLQSVTAPQERVITRIVLR